MKLVWLNKRPTNYDMLKSALPYGTSDVPELIRKICSGGRENVVVLDDELFSKVFTHASVISTYQYFVANFDVKISGCTVGSGNIVQLRGYWFIRESVAVELQVVLDDGFDITVSDLEKNYGVETRTARAREFESYNVLKRVWLAITKQVIF